MFLLGKKQGKERKAGSAVGDGGWSTYLEDFNYDIRKRIKFILKSARREP